MTKMRNALSLVLLLVLALTLIPSAIAGSSAVVPIGVGQQGTIKWQWETDSDVCICSTPAIGPDGNIYVTAYGGTATWVPARLFCVSPQGSMLWKSQELDHIGASDPVIASDGTIYVVGYYKLYAFNPGGSLKWEWTTPEDGDPYPHAQICGVTLGADGTIYTSHCGAGSYHRHLFALNPDGSMKWTRDLADPDIGNGIGALTVGKDGVLYGQGTHWVNYSMYAFDPDNGAVLWPLELGDSARGGFAIGSDGTIYVPLSPQKLAAITPDGTIKWEYDMAARPGIPSIGSDGTIYVTGDKLYALTSSGQLKWTASDGSAGDPGVAIASDGTIYSRLWHSEKEQHLLTAVNPDGSIKWLMIPIPFEAGTPAIGPDGTIYVTGGCRPGVLTAVDGSGPLVSSDSDGDGVPNDEDRCDDTPLGTEVDEDGCPVEVPDSEGDAYAQTSVTLQSFFGEGSYQEGYDFSAYAVQRWGEGGPDNPSLSPDFYLGDPFTPLTTSEFYDPKYTIDYGVVSLASITEIPDHADPRFASNNFVAGQTYGMFTNEGDYVVLQVVDTVEEFVDNDLTIRMTFNWVYVEGGLAGELTISLYPYDKPEFALGDSPTIGGDVLAGGQPLANAQVCTEVRGDAGEYMYGACHFTDANGQFPFWLEYGVDIPTGYRGNLVVEAEVAHNDTVAEQTIYVPYGSQTLDLPLELQLWGPLVPIQIGGWEELQIGGTVTSQGGNVDGATVTMVVAGGTFQTTTGMVNSGEFYYGWSNDNFPAGDYWVEVTVSKTGYQDVTGSVSFTVFGEGYDFWVTMDPIPATLDPGSNVPFPGTLTLGGNPVSDWINIYVTFPNGRTNGYSNLTDADGRFTHTQPSLTEIGSYQLVVHYQADDKQISDVYTFAVGATPTPTVTPARPQPTQVALICKIIDVVYPSIVFVGENVDVTGKVVCTEGYDGEEIIPQEGWDIHVIGNAPYESPVKAPVVQTSGDGSFAATLTPNVFYIQELIIVARDPEINRYGRVRWFGPVSVVIGVDPSITLSQTDYDQGEIVAGELKLDPSSFVKNWDSGVEIFYQITGPVDGVTKQYLFESQYYDHTYIGGVYVSADGITPFSWTVPHDAGGGKYTITAYISGQNIATQTVEADFYVSDIQHTNLTALVESDPDGWVSATLAGQYTDFQGVPLPNADVRVSFLIVKWNDEGTEIIETREFKLTGTTDEFGSYEINLEPLDLFAGQGQEDPWEPYWATTTVYADKEGYATGAVIIDVRIPTVKARMEIISVNPPLDHLSEMAQSGMSYEQLTEMNIQVRVRYNNIFAEGAKLAIFAEGNWAVTCSVEDDIVTYKPYLSINGEQKPEWEAYKYGDWWGARQNTSSWSDGTLHPPFYYYPKHDVKMPAQHGIAQESTISVSGRLFGYRYSENSPNQCGGTAYGADSPVVPPPWVGARPAVKIGVSLGGSSAVVVYNITPPSISASGSAWVSPTGGEFNGKLNVGQATGFALHNHQVNLSIVAADIGVTEVSTETEKTTSEITIESSAITDDKGELNLPLTAKTNPCKLEKKARYYVKITNSAFDGEKYIPIELRCVEELKFEFSEADISVVQVVDLTDNNPIKLAAGKEAGVRVYLKVDGEIYQPENRPVQVKVSFEMLTDGSNAPLFPQTKTISLSEKGASVTGIGEVVNFDNNSSGVSGSEKIYVDFIFAPHLFGGSQTNFNIRITVDPDEVYGEKLSAEKVVSVKKMKTIHLHIVPVNIASMDMGFVLKHTSFLLDTYPLGWGDMVLYPQDTYSTSEIPPSCTSLTYLKEIACGLGVRFGSGGDSNNMTKVWGIIDNATWLQGWYNNTTTMGAYAVEFWDSATVNVVLVRYPDNVSYTTAHEVGHSFGLELSEQYKDHPPNGLPVTGLILRDSQIFDTSAHLGNNDTASLKKLQNLRWGGVSELFDFMGNPGYYEDAVDGGLRWAPEQDAWTIKETWNALFDALEDPPDKEIFFIQSVIGVDGLVTLNPVVLMDGLPDEPSTDGEYELQILSSSKDVLYSTRFGSASKPGLVNLYLPYIAGVGQIVVLREGMVVGELQRSPSPPEISFLPLADANDEDMLNISWVGNDPDGDTLTYSLHYSCDETILWMPIAANLKSSSYQINLAHIAGGICTLKITASDGINSTYALTDFRTSLKPPTIQILTDKTIYDANETVFLKGIAFSLSDGILPNENLIWFSDIDGELGTGSALLATLSPGIHQLTLKAIDSTGNISLATATIEIGAVSRDILTGMGTGLQSLWLIGFLILAVLMLGSAGFLLVTRRKPAPVAPPVTPPARPVRPPGRPEELLSRRPPARPEGPPERLGGGKPSGPPETLD